MADTKNLERDYVIPLRRDWLKVAKYRRTARSVKAIKAFIAKHMKVENRDVKKVRLDPYLNNEVWFRGCKKPPAKVNVRAKKEGDTVFVTFVEAPEVVKYAMARHEKRHKKTTKKKVVDHSEEKKDKPDAAQKEAETEKEKSVEQAQNKIADQAAKTQKHTVGKTNAPQIQRKALQK